MKPEFIVIIPARYESSRFPGKPLALIAGKPMVLHAAENAELYCDRVFIATDDQRIAETAVTNGHQVILTGTHHRTGTERCAEALSKIPEPVDPDTLVVNVQGDEPFLPGKVLSELVWSFARNPDQEIATLVREMHQESDAANPNRVKVVMDRFGKALYFSRAAIPWQQSPVIRRFLHIGTYAFRQKTLKDIVRLPGGKLEAAESLEQLRWMEHGFPVHCLVTDYSGFGIDTPEDLIEAEAQLRKTGL